MNRRSTDRIQPATGPWQVVAEGVCVERSSWLSALLSHPHPFSALAEVAREWWAGRTKAAKGGRG